MPAVSVAASIHALAAIAASGGGGDDGGGARSGSQPATLRRIRIASGEGAACEAGPAVGSVGARGGRRHAWLAGVTKPSRAAISREPTASSSLMTDRRDCHSSPREHRCSAAAVRAGTAINHVAAASAVSITAAAAAVAASVVAGAPSPIGIGGAGSAENQLSSCRLPNCHRARPHRNPPTSSPRSPPTRTSAKTPPSAPPLVASPWSPQSPWSSPLSAGCVASSRASSPAAATTCVGSRFLEVGPAGAPGDAPSPSHRPPPLPCDAAAAGGGKGSISPSSGSPSAASPESRYTYTRPLAVPSSSSRPAAAGTGLPRRAATWTMHAQRTPLPPVGQRYCTAAVRVSGRAVVKEVRPGSCGVPSDACFPSNASRRKTEAPATPPTVPQAATRMGPPRPPLGLARPGSATAAYESSSAPCSTACNRQPAARGGWPCTWPCSSRWLS
eukprot:scaffold14290_cov63-Phaeocystis_antarctica.AAC.9